MKIGVTYKNNTKKEYEHFDIDKFEDIENITKLYCRFNQSTENVIPENIGLLINLKILDCCYNQLTSLPESISNLVNLESLFCSQNKLTSLPESIGNLVNLKKLYFNHNQLTSLPESISNLVNLEKLCCSNNPLTDNAISRSIGNLVNLEALWISNIQLTNEAIPSEVISKLTNLKLLICYDNQLTSLPLGILNLRKLELFQYHNNPLGELPVEIQRFIHRIETR